MFDLEWYDASSAARFPRHAFPAAIAVALCEQTGGNPLFLVSALDELELRGWLRQVDGRWQCMVPLDEIRAAVPDGTLAMIETRLERLAPADLELLETASVMGGHSLAGSCRPERSRPVCGRGTMPAAGEGTPVPRARGMVFWEHRIAATTARVGSPPAAAEAHSQLDSLLNRFPETQQLEDLQAATDLIGT